VSSCGERLYTSIAAGYAKVEARFLGTDARLLRMQLQSRSRRPPSDQCKGRLGLLRLSTQDHEVVRVPDHLVSAFGHETVAIRRGTDGLLTMGVGVSFAWNDHGMADLSQEIRYTLDGSGPTAASARYEQPLSLPLGGHIRARAFSGDRVAR
jgi:hypothetical protein